MIKIRIIGYLFLLFGIFSPSLNAQGLTSSEIQFLTNNWNGERFEDGRPKVSKGILERMKKVSIEEAWGVLRNEGFHNQFEGGWEPLHDDVTIVGRALTVQYLPNRPDVSEQIKGIQYFSK